MPTSENTRRALENHIIAVSEDSLIAIDDIGQHHFPKQVQSFTFGPIFYMGFLKACLNGMVLPRMQNTRFCINR